MPATQDRRSRPGRPCRSYGSYRTHGTYESNLEAPRHPPKRTTTFDLSATEALGRRLGLLFPNAVVALDLRSGAGKTHLVGPRRGWGREPGRGHQPDLTLVHSPAGCRSSTPIACAGRSSLTWSRVLRRPAGLSDRVGSGGCGPARRPVGHPSVVPRRRPPAKTATGPAYVRSWTTCKRKAADRSSRPTVAVVVQSRLSRSSAWSSGKDLLQVHRRRRAGPLRQVYDRQRDQRPGAGGMRPSRSPWSPERTRSTGRTRRRTRSRVQPLLLCRKWEKRFIGTRRQPAATAAVAAVAAVAVAAAGRRDGATS